MSYEDLVGEVVRRAVSLGYPGEQAQAAPEAAVDWLAEYLKTALETPSEQERAEAMAGSAALRDRRI